MYNCKFVVRLALRIVFLIASVSGYAQNSVAYCDLVRHPDKYNGKEVSVRATYKYGFEWEELYCLECKEKGKTWLELIPASLDKASEKALNRVPKGAGIVNVTVQGGFTLVSGGHFGHLNGYPYKFVASKVSNVEVVVKGMKDRAEEEKAEKKWAWREQSQMNRIDPR